MESGKGELLEAMTTMRFLKLTSMILFVFIVVRGTCETTTLTQEKEWLSYQPVPYKEFTGKTVLVEGTLFHGFTGRHHTDVLMDVRSIKLEHWG
jgi:hypothetical protein